MLPRPTPCPRTFVVALGFALTACAADTEHAPDDSERAFAKPAIQQDDPLYAMVTHVWSDDGPTGYVALMDSLDVDGVQLKNAREFPGYTSIGVADGVLLVSPSAEDPTIDRYQIGDDLSWVVAGDPLGFGGEGADEVDSAG